VTDNDLTIGYRAGQEDGVRRLKTELDQLRDRIVEFADRLARESSAAAFEEESTLDSDIYYSHRMGGRNEAYSESEGLVRDLLKGERDL
jgi:hypothetical protein